MHQTSDYVPCPECHKFVLRSCLRKHSRTCVKKNADCCTVGSGINSDACLATSVYRCDETSLPLNTSELSSTISDVDETVDNNVPQNAGRLTVNSLVQSNVQAWSVYSTVNTVELLSDGGESLDNKLLHNVNCSNVSASTKGDTNVRLAASLSSCDETSSTFPLSRVTHPVETLDAGNVSQLLAESDVSGTVQM